MVYDTINSGTLPTDNILNTPFGLLNAFMRPEVLALAFALGAIALFAYILYKLSPQRHLLQKGF